LFREGPVCAGSSKSGTNFRYLTRSIVIEDVRESYEAGQNPLPVYFYCSRTAAEPERSDPDAVLSSILRQLCNQPGNAIYPPIVEKYTQQGQGFRSKGLQLKDSLGLIMELIETNAITTIVVDALDECDPEKRQSLLDAFETILQESAGLVKIFVSSRDDQDIVWTLREYPSFDITSDQNSRDIEAFVNAETQRLIKKGRLLRNSRARGRLQGLIIDRVCKGADGMSVLP